MSPGKAKATRGVRGRGRGRGKPSEKIEIDSNGGAEEKSDVPELDDGPAPPTISRPTRRTPVKLNSSSLQAAQDEDEEEIEEVKADAEKTTEVTSSENLGNSESIESALMDGEENTENSKTGEDLETDEIEKAILEGKDGGKGDENMVEEAKEESAQPVEEDPRVDKMEVDNKESERVEAAVEDAEMVSEDEYFVETNKPLDTEAVSDDELQGSQSAELPETEEVSDDELPNEKAKVAKVEEAEAVSEDELPDEEDKKDEEKKKPVSESEEKQELDSSKKEDVAIPVKKDGKRKHVEGEYDPSSPTSENSQDGGSAAKRAAVGDDKATTPKPVGKKPLPELEKYWKTVKDDPSDFTGWTYLLQYVDQENDTEVAREAYDAFLSHYPYCYGYWRKYADFEKRKANLDECQQVFERGLKAIPLSVDLWLHYLNHCRAIHSGNPDHIREQYERAIKACGHDFRSDRLWEHYIKWEKERRNLINITLLYDRLLAIPTQAYTTHFDNFQDHVNGNAPQTILPVDEFLEIRREVVAALKSQQKMSTAPPGEEGPPGEESGAADTARMEEETSALREKILAIRRKVHKATVSAVASRWNFEEGIKRPYFHVKPLERCQLKNWKEYLDYEIEHGDEHRVTILFERCLIACALYEEFWVRYIRYLETLKTDQTSKIRDVYERACLTHHKKKPNLHLQWAVFEESKKNFDKAATILETMDKTTPNMLQVIYRRINLERRRNEFGRVAELYEEYLAQTKNKSLITNMTVKYARFTWKMMNDVDKAISILENALEKDKDNTRLYLQLIDMGLQKNPVDEDKIVGILDQFLDKEGDPEQKLMFAQRKIEFLEDFGSNIERVQAAQDDFQKYVKLVKDKKKKSEGPEQPPLPTTAQSPITISAPAKKKTDMSSTTSPAVTTISSTGTTATFPATAAQSYPPNYYGQYPPPPTAEQGAAGTYPPNYTPGYNNYPNWNNYPQGGYGNYGQGWPGYYPNY